MFDSGITVQVLIEGIQSEADIAPDIPVENYLLWLNSVEQLLYTEIINEQKKYSFDKDSELVESGAKPNYWEGFSSETVDDVQLEVTAKGEYIIRSASWTGGSAGGAWFTREVTLPAGTYTLTDSSEPYEGDNIPANVFRTYVADTADVAVRKKIAGIPMLAGPEASVTFTLPKETAVTLTLHTASLHTYPTEGYRLIPVLKMVSPVVVCKFPESTTEAQMRFEDIYAVYADNTQLIKSTLASGVIFPDTYFKDSNKLCMHLSELPEVFSVIYRVRPKIKKKDSWATTNVRVPVEFIDLVKAKLRGEAYKLANEDSLAAKWLNDYNVLLETFREWVRTKSPEFGL